VVCVNLQGLFIFCFHCVRNTTVRSEWKSVVSRIQTFSVLTTRLVRKSGSKMIHSRSGGTLICYSINQSID